MVIGGLLGARFLVLSTPSSNRDVPKGTPLGPVPPTSLTEVPRLREAVVVVVAELGVGGVTPRALEVLVMLWPEPPLH